MKVLKGIGLFIAALVVVILLVGLVMPTEYSVSRSILLTKSRAEVFPLVSSLQSQEKWSPWVDYDPNMKVVFTGTSGTVGEQSAWEGNSDVGKGTQVIKEIKANEMVHNQLTFEEPFTSVSDAYILLTDEADGTRVTWKMEGAQPYPTNVMALFVDLNDLIGKDFDKGLNKLKKLSEAAPTPMASR